MSKRKSMGVTCLVAALLGVATFSAYRLCMPAFIVLTAMFSAIGFLAAASLFCAWLEQEPVREEEAEVVPVMLAPKRAEPEPECMATVDEIMQEARSEVG